MASLTCIGQMYEDLHKFWQASYTSIMTEFIHLCTCDFMSVPDVVLMSFRLRTSNACRAYQQCGKRKHKQEAVDQQAKTALLHCFSLDQKRGK